MPALDPAQRIKVAINTTLLNKNEGRTSFVDNFQNVEFTITELAHHVNQGLAFSSQLSGQRRKASFLCSSVLVIDFDGQRSLDDVRTDPFIREHLSFLYTTIRHTSDHHRFRLVFALPEPIEDPDQMNAALRSLSLKVSGNRASADAAHLFFGSKGSDPELFQRALSASMVEELIKRGLDADKRINRDRAAMTSVSRQTIHPDHILTLDDGSSASFGSLPIRTRVKCPFHYDQSASAFITTSANGKTTGVHCLTCGQSFWPPNGIHEVDFRDFEKALAAAEAYFAANLDHGPFQEAISSNFHPGLKECDIHRLPGGFVSLPRPVPKGVIFIKSPKGTGKTEELSRILLKEPGRTLLIGHRIALIEQTCDRLALDCYLDEPAGEIHWSQLGVCLDSLARLAAPSNTRQFIDNLIIDESEQVLSHFLSGTIRDHDRNEIFQIFRLLVRSSKRVFALDADLGWLTFETLSKMVSDPENKYEPKKCTVYLNERSVSTEVQVYGAKGHLISELNTWAQSGRRLFVPSNSKRLLTRLNEGFKKKMPQVRTLLITSDTTGEEVVKAFIKNPRTETLKYDVIFASPTLGTGIDITFENNESLIDGVFGLFETGVSTHFEIDQQIWRVRHPGCVKVWVSPATYFFDTSRDVIQRDIQKNNLFMNTLSHFDIGGKPVYHTNLPLIDMAALAQSQQVASKNNLKKNLIDLKTSHGHIITYVEKNSPATSEGMRFEAASAALEEEQYRTSILNARRLTREEFDKLDEKSKNHRTPVDRVGRLALERYRIERFYRRSLDHALIDLDDRGRFRTRVITFEGVLKAASASAPKADLGLKQRFLPTGEDRAHLILELLTCAGVIEGDRLATEAEFSVISLMPFMTRCVELRGDVEGVLEIEVGDNLNDGVRKLGKVLDKIGLGIERTRSSRAKKLAGGKKIRFYRLVEPMLRTIEGVVDDRQHDADHFRRELTELIKLGELVG
ncbi:hypothetical protein HNQ36_003449 [Afipia massiliensis]|uniref:Replication origin-binding protein domain-containing protein n=1 Tax=Afipia massiliensis TaxID=211460 RepID=A0A840N6K0_9BRAD|nr:plasmid replication protein, CyRepA1 family [Afipia massiliensis]MBB5053458.1 hypothetical protein [Afipia massiliensis]